jgi:alkanesulfonate monooxygenase SsuD/methylene tetrahydromethanopterin reductase-like flavin-dependent oxidoreductase (luciferase family)
MTPVVGAIHRPQLPPEHLVSSARAAEALGVAEVWVWEDCFLTAGVSAATAALASTDELTVGLGLMPAPLRNVAIAAMEIATVSRLFPGRFRVAVGHGVQDWMGQVGARAASPVTLLREYVVALRALLRGETVTTDGDYVRLDAVRLDWPPTMTPPVLIGAVGPRSLALAGEVADGVLLDADLTEQGARDAIGICLDARRSAGVTEPFEVVAYQRAYRGPDAAEQLAADARPGGIAAGVVDDAAAAAQQVHALGAAGVGTVVLMPSATQPDAESYLRWVATDVRSALATKTSAGR